VRVYGRESRCSISEERGPPIAIDSKKVKDFWEAQARKLGTVKCESVTNLEEDPTLLEIKLELEKEKVSQYVHLDDGTTVLDLGAGTGNWSFHFAERCKRVIAVEYIRDLVEVGKRRAREKNLDNVEFVCCHVQEFVPTERIDLVFVSGLFVYLNDDDCARLLSAIRTYAKAGCRLVVRDGVGILDRYEIHDRYSENLRAYYSAVYRTRQEYIDMFDAIGFARVKDEDMFAAGCVLNKYPETRLRIFLFRKDG